MEILKSKKGRVFELVCAKTLIFSMLLPSFLLPALNIAHAEGGEPPYPYSQYGPSYRVQPEGGTLWEPRCGADQCDPWPKIIPIIVSGPGAKVVISWDRGSCSVIYGAVDKTEISGNYGQVTLPVKSQGVIGCGAEENYQIVYKDPGIQSDIFCPIYGATTAKFNTYTPLGTTAPSQAHPLETSLHDQSKSCGFVENQNDPGKGDPNIASPTAYPPPDNNAGWSYVIQNLDRITRVNYKNDTTVSVCNKIFVERDPYRANLFLGEECLNGECTQTQVVPKNIIKISQDAHESVTEEKCLDHAFNDDIVSLSIPQCNQSKKDSIFTTTVTVRCDTQVLAANGKAGACHYEKSKSGFGGFLGFFIGYIILVVFTVATGGAGGIIAAGAFALFGVTIAAEIAALLTLTIAFTSSVVFSSLGTISAPKQELGTCTWSNGFILDSVQPPAGSPTCAENSCTFNPKTITDGGQTTFSWNVSQNTTRYEWNCRKSDGSPGDLGAGLSGDIPGSAPYQGSAALAPHETQSCVLKLFDSAGLSREYQDTITVNPAVSSNAPSCSLSFTPSQILSGQSTQIRWNLSTNTGRVAYDCGGLGSATVSVPADINYSGFAEVHPTTSETCRATVYNSAGVNGSCAANITVERPSSPPPPIPPPATPPPHSTPPPAPPPAPQTLNVSLSANPDSGNAPLTGVDLSASISGNATGPINYTFYCDRADSGTNITTGWSRKFDAASETSKLAAHACTYQYPGVYSAKVIAERGSARAESRKLIAVLGTSGTPPPPGMSATLRVNGGTNDIEIPYNSSITISWSSSGATQCAVIPAGFEGVSGSRSIPNIISTKTYTLLCDGPAGSVTKSVTISITPQAIIPINLPSLLTLPVAVSGHVVDQDKDGVPGVKIQLCNIRGTGAYSQITDADGDFSVLNVPFGQNYCVRIQSLPEGYENIRIRPIGPLGEYGLPDTATTSYEWQVAGRSCQAEDGTGSCQGNAAEWDLASDTNFGFKITKIPPLECELSFAPSSIIRGATTSLSWNFPVGTTHQKLSCTGNMGTSEGTVPDDTPESGKIIFKPTQSQTCTVTIKDFRGRETQCTSAIEVK